MLLLLRLSDHIIVYVRSSTLIHWEGKGVSHYTTDIKSTECLLLFFYSMWIRLDTLLKYPKCPTLCYSVSVGGDGCFWWWEGMVEAEGWTTYYPCCCVSCLIRYMCDADDSSSITRLYRVWIKATLCVFRVGWGWESMVGEEGWTTSYPCCSVSCLIRYMFDAGDSSSITRLYRVWLLATVCLQWHMMETK